MPPRKQPCANPLFLEWLEDLRDAARDKGLKSADAYNKGCRSLQQCPIRYERPRDLKSLAGIGEKTIVELEKKLRDHCARTGEPYPSDPPRGAAAAAARRARQDEEEEESDDPEDENAQPKKKRRVSTKTYIPAPRTGAYGILIGMLDAQDEPEDAIDERLTRGEIIKYAQPFCDSSYSHSEKGTWVTAWNAMKTLVSKGYVSVQGMPHRYSLTYEGFDVAAVIRNMDEAFSDKEKLVPFRLRGENGIPTHHALTAAANAANSQSTASSRQAPRASTSSQQPAAPHAPGRFCFCYIDRQGRRVDRVQEAASKLCPVEFISLRRIEFLSHQRDHPIVKQLRLIDETETLHHSGRITLFAYIVDDGAPPMCSGFGSSNASIEPPAPDSPPPAASRTSSTTVSRPWSASLSRTPSAHIPVQNATAGPSNALAGPSRNALCADAALSRTASITASSSSSDTAPPRHNGPRLSSQMPLPGEDRDVPDFDPSDAIVFPKGSYEIILVLDTREVESRENRDHIQETLERKGVKVETRALRLGDVCWVARRHDSYGAEEHECVLDFVVERKRLDDLVTSIQDGRYKEQGFRLGQSGIKNIFYIVEDYQKTARMQSFGKGILTAKSQVQIVHGFFLKETHKLNDTIDYLVTMTSVIKQQSHDLKVLPSRYIHRNSYSSFQKHLRATHPNEAFLTSFEAYQELNKKSSVKTVHEYLARMLLRVRGMSPEKASAVLDVWQTPRALFEAMRARHAQGPIVEGRKKRGPELMFHEQVAGEGRRAIGMKLSKDIWTCLWGCIPEYPEGAGAGSASTSSTATTTTTTTPRIATPAASAAPAIQDKGKGKAATGGRAATSQDKGKPTPFATQRVAQDKGKTTPFATQRVAQDKGKATPFATQRVAQDQGKTTPFATQRVAQDKGKTTPFATQARTTATQNLGKGKANVSSSPAVAGMSAADRLRAELWGQIGQDYDLPGASRHRPQPAAAARPSESSEAAETRRRQAALGAAMRRLSSNAVGNATAPTQSSAPAARPKPAPMDVIVIDSDDD